MQQNVSHETIILARMGEIALKGLNRGKFEGKLMNNLRYRLRSFGSFHIFQSQSRIWIEPDRYPIKDNEPGRVTVSFQEEPEKAKEVLAAVTEVFGIVSASLVWRFPGGLDEIADQAIQFVSSLLLCRGYKSFKVETKRAEKSFPTPSLEVSAEVGGRICEAFPDLLVDVNNPDFVVYIEIRDVNYLYCEKIYGHRGLPVGTAGTGMLLLSGGIDSPVAGYMMASRGMMLEAVYFHSYPYTSDRAKQKVIDLAHIVSHFAGRMTLHVVDFTSIQLELYQNSPHDMLTITMRSVMMRIAEGIASRRGCKALITGESLGQVASQTLEALYLTNEVVTMPVFRPLIGLDKEATTIIARRIGSFDTSILPYEDCCTVFVAKHPRTHPHPSHVLDAEKGLDVSALVERGLSAVEEIYI